MRYGLVGHLEKLNSYQGLLMLSATCKRFRAVPWGEGLKEKMKEHFKHVVDPVVDMVIAQQRETERLAPAAAFAAA